MRVLALDYGSARCGCAVSDPTGTIVTPIAVVAEPGTRAGLARVLEVVAEREVEHVVVGLPLSLRGEDTDGLVLRVLLPLLDATSTRLLASHVPLPAGISDPRRRHAEISRALDGLAAAGRVRGARELTTLAGFAPPTLLGQAARLQAGQRAFNLAVTNIPGPSTPRRLLGRELRAILPAMPLARNQTLSVAIASFCGRLHFGLLADGETLGDPNELAALLETSLAELRKGARGKTLRSRP